MVFFLISSFLFFIILEHPFENPVAVGFEKLPHIVFICQKDTLY
jgi:hypothetical protein